MANIKEYNAGSLALQIPETGIEATAQAARRIGTFYNQAGESITNVGQRLGRSIADVGDAGVSYLEHREKSLGAASLSGKLDDWSKQWEETAKNADPNDPAVANKFMSTVVEPGLKEWQGAFNTEGGQTWAENRVDTIRNHFFQKTSSTMAANAGTAAINNLTITANRMTNLVKTSPESIPLALDMIDTAVDGARGPTMTAEEWAKISGPLKQKMKEAVVKSGISGIADVDPDRAEAVVNAGTYKDYLNFGDTKQMINYARAQRRISEQGDRLAEAERRRQVKEQSDDRALEYMNELVDPNTGEVRIPEGNVKKFLGKVYANADRKLTREGIAAVSSAVNRIVERGHADHDAPGLVNDLLGRVRLREDDPRYASVEDVLKHVGVDLTQNSFRFIEGVRKNQDKPEVKSETAQLDSVKRVLSSVFPKTDPFLGQVDEAMARARFNFEQWFWPEYYSQRQSGVGPSDLLHPGSGKYLLKDEWVRTFKVQARQELDAQQGEETRRRSTPSMSIDHGWPMPNTPSPRTGKTPPPSPVPFAPNAGPNIDITPGATFKDRFSVEPEKRKSLKEIFFGSP